MNRHVCLATSSRRKPDVPNVYGQAYDARYNRLTFEWEDLSGLTNHYAYAMLVMDPNSGEVLGSSVTQNNALTWTLAVNTNYSFVIIGYDTNQQQYCNSLRYTFNTGPALWTAATTRSLGEKKVTLSMNESAQMKVEVPSTLSPKNEILQEVESTQNFRITENGIEAVQ